MKSKKFILALTMTIAMGLGITAYASAEPSSTTVVTNTTDSANTSVHKKAGIKRVTGMKGPDYVKAVLKNKLGMTDEEITAGLDAGKTMYDLAKEKGMTEEAFKAALLEEKNKSIDNAVAAGTITTEEGASVKETIKNNMDNCTGIPGERGNSSGSGNGCGKKGGNGISCDTRHSSGTRK